MSTSTITTSRSARVQAEAYNPVTGFFDVLLSEFLKIRSVPSTFWTLLATLVSNIGIAILAGLFIPSHMSASDKRTVDAIRLSLAGMHLSQIAVGVLGVLIITSEYSSGMIRVTLAAKPQRSEVLAAKAIVFSATALVIGTVSCFVGYFAFEAVLPANSGMTSSISDPGVMRALFGGGLYLAVLGLLGLGLGAVIRAGAGAISALFGLLFVPNILLDLLPSTWQNDIGKYLPMAAGTQIFVAVHHDPNSLSAWTGLGVFAIYAAVAVIFGFTIITRRDA